MGYPKELFETDYPIDTQVAIEEFIETGEVTAWEQFDDEINSWARAALAANGFGDY